MVGLEAIALQIENQKQIDNALNKVPSRPAYEQVVKQPNLSERLAGYGLRVVNAVMSAGVGDAYGGDESGQSIIDMYDWDGVCTKKSNYRIKVPSAKGHVKMLDADDFINKYQDNLTFRSLIDSIPEMENVIKDLYNQKISDGEISFFSLKEGVLQIRILTYDENLTDFKERRRKDLMRYPNSSIYFVWKEIDKKTSDKLMPYFNEKL